MLLIKNRSNIVFVLDVSLYAKLSTYILYVARGCNTSIGGQRQSGCMQPVCFRSSSELRISVWTMFKDAARLSWVGLVNQVLPSRDSCWLAYANGVIMSSSLSPVEGIVLQTIVLPKICSSSSSSGAAWGSPCSGAASAARSRRSS